MYPLLQAFKIGVKLAEENYRDELVNTVHTVPTDFSNRVDEMRDIIQARLTNSPEMFTSGNFSGDPFPGDSVNVNFFHSPKRAIDRPHTEGPVRWQDNIYLNSGYAGRLGSKSKNESGEELLWRSRDKGYVNPLLLAHEASHSYGADEVEADAYAAMSNYDHRDLADFYNFLRDRSTDGELVPPIPGDDHLGDGERLRLFSSMLGGGSKEPVNTSITPSRKVPEINAHTPTPTTATSPPYTPLTKVVTTASPKTQ